MEDKVTVSDMSAHFLFGAVKKVKYSFPEGGRFNYSPVDKKVVATVISPKGIKEVLYGVATSKIMDNKAWYCVNARVLKMDDVDFSSVYLQAELNVSKNDPELSSAILYLRAFPASS